MDDGNTIGDRLQRLRRDRGLTQEELAAASDVSKEIISKLERGVRTSARLTTISKLSHGLDVEVSELVDRRDHMKSERDGGSVLAVRDALLNPGLLPGIDTRDGGEPTPLPLLEATLVKGWTQYRTGKFGELLALLPSLIGEARITHQAAGAGAAQPLALAYDLASGLMTQIGRTDLGAVAAERAITVAHGGDDPLLWATIHASYSWVLFHQARYEEAERLAADMADRIEPSFRDGDLKIAVWGHLLLTTIAPAAALERDPAEYLSLARAAAARLREPVRVYLRSGPFSAPLVDMQATYGYSALKKTGKALDAAKRIHPGDLQGISWGAHLMDVAAAHAERGHRKTAVRALMEARSVSPVWFRHQRVAREAVTELREQETRLSPEVKSLARSLDL